VATYYSARTAYAKSKGFSITVGNAGTDVPESFIGTVDVILIYESPGLPNVGSLGGWHLNHDKRNFGIIPYSVPSLDTAFVQQAKTSIGYIYSTRRRRRRKPVGLGRELFRALAGRPGAVDRGNADVHRRGGPDRHDTIRASVTSRSAMRQRPPRSATTSCTCRRVPSARTYSSSPVNAE
jgi:hypothetical protein